MIGNILEFQDLQRLCRPKAKGRPPRLSTVEAWAKAQGIAFGYDKDGGIWTTQEAVNAALGIRAANDDQAAGSSSYGAEDV